MRTRTIILILFVISVVVTQQANAEIFVLEATSEHDRNDYLYLEFFWDGNEILTKNAFLKHDNYVLVFDGTPAKFYTSHGFSMKAPDLGIAIYGHPVNTLADLEYYLTVIIQGENGKEKLKFYSHGISEENSEPVVEEIPADPLAEYEEAQTLTGPALVSELERIAEEERLAALPVVVEEPYIPELLITSSHDSRTYWQDTFNVNVQTFDGNINSDPESSSDFEGRIDGVDVKVLLSLDGEEVATLSGVTANNGHWDGEYYVPANISPPGEYVIEVIASYLGEIISKSTSMFVINTVIGSDGSTNHSPVAFAGNDETYFEFEDFYENGDPIYIIITLDGTGSTDPDRDVITYSWIQTSGIPVSLNDSTSVQPTFEAPNVSEDEDLVFTLTVTDVKGLKSEADSVTITIAYQDKEFPGQTED